jgi:hypothetical protein
MKTIDTVLIESISTISARSHSGALDMLALAAQIARSCMHLIPSLQHAEVAGAIDTKLAEIDRFDRGVCRECCAWKTIDEARDVLLHASSVAAE